MPSAKTNYIRAAACLMLLQAAPVEAQEQRAGAETERSDIVVTAQRREQNLQDVPIAVTAITAQRIDDEAILNLDRLGANVPNQKNR